MIKSADKIISPSINLCKIDPVSNLCAGCKRSGFEITNWIFFTDEERKSILDSLHQRKNQSYIREQEP